MSSETKLHLAEKLRQNWQSLYPYIGRTDNRILQPEILKLVNRDISESVQDSVSNASTPIDDSLTNLNWLQNLNLFSMPQCQEPLSPSPTNYFQLPTSKMTPVMNTISTSNRLTHPFFESNSLYAEVAQNLEFINEQASVHFFKVNNQLRPPFSDINLISMAIYSYNKGKVSFPDICLWIEETFPYYKITNQDWKIGIKNHLTLSKCFQKVPRKKDEAEKGGFWRFSNDFLNYLDKNRFLRRNIGDIAVSGQQENFNQSDFRFGKFLPRKRTATSSGPCDENGNLAFKTPCKRANLFDGQMILDLADFDRLIGGTFDDETPAGSVVKTEGTTRLFCNSTLSNCDNSFSQVSHLFETSKIDSRTFQSSVDGIQLRMGNQACPEQLTEEEFLSGRLFSHNLLTSQSNLENIPTLLGSHINYSFGDVNNLSITGVSIRPPEWWNQSLSASQISISKLGCSLRSLTSVGNIERSSPFADEDQHVIWHTDQNLEELDILFGLN